MRASRLVCSECGLQGASVEERRLPGRQWVHVVTPRPNPWSWSSVCSLQRPLPRPGSVHLRGDELKASCVLGGREGAEASSPAGSAKETGKSGCSHSVASSERFTLPSLISLALVGCKGTIFPTTGLHKGGAGRPPSPLRWRDLGLAGEAFLMQHIWLGTWGLECMSLGCTRRARGRVPRPPGPHWLVAD